MAERRASHFVSIIVRASDYPSIPLTATFAGNGSSATYENKRCIK